MKTKKNTLKVSVIDQFIIDFAEELDLFQTRMPFPDWVFCYRDDHIRKLTSETRKIAKRLKELGLRFKIRWPIEINGEWKYADFYFPKQKTVLMVTNAKALGSRPHWMLSDRAEFFKSRFRVVEIENVRDLERKMEMKLAST